MPAQPWRFGFRSRDFRRFGAMALLYWTLPELERAFGTLPPRILVISTLDHPMPGFARGNSCFVRANLPLVDRAGSSVLLHELVHVVSGVTSDATDQWISEGLAEYYAFELMHRAGLPERHLLHRLSRLERESAGVNVLPGRERDRALYGGAALVMHALDREISARTGGRKSLDDAARAVANSGGVSRERFEGAVQEALDGRSSVRLHALLHDRRRVLQNEPDEPDELYPW